MPSRSRRSSGSRPRRSCSARRPFHRAVQGDPAGPGDAGAGRVPGQRALGLLLGSDLLDPRRRARARRRSRTSGSWWRCRARTTRSSTTGAAGPRSGSAAPASNTIIADDVFVPAHLAVRYDWKDFEMPRGGTIGFQLHRNPLYLARAMTFFYASLNATQIGNARAALGEYEAMMTTRPTSFPPPMPRSESVDYQRWFGEAYSLVDTAELAFFGAIARFADKCVGVRRARRAVHHRRRRRHPRRARPVRQAGLAGGRSDVRHRRLQRRPAWLTAGALFP